MAGVLLATCSAHPHGEPGAELLDAALRERGVAASWACWDDPSIDWAGADRVFVRSTWDYQHRVEEFLTWAERVGPGLVSSATTIRWNLDKAYLRDLAGVGLPVVPTVSVDTVGQLRAAVAELGSAVVKPRTGASGEGVRLVTAGQEHGEDGGPWIVQPLVESVRTRGEVSVFVMDGVAVSRVDKRPAPGEIRVHEEYGGSSAAGILDAASAALAADALRAAGRVLGEPAPPFGRVDLMWWEGRWVVGELELVEPGLYLDVHPGNAAPFADLVVALL